MKKNNDKASISNKTNNKVCDKTNNNITNSNRQNNKNIGFDKANASKSFHYDENSDHSFELRDSE